MRDINSYDACLYLGLCVLNTVLLSVSCWLLWIWKFWIAGFWLLLTVGAVIDVIMVLLRNDSITSGWHLFMAISVGICSILGMGVYTAIHCTAGNGTNCSYMIAVTVIGIIISIIEVFIIVVGKRAGYQQGCCCCSSPQVKPQVYPVVATYPHVQLTTPSVQVPVITTTMQVPMSTVTVVPSQPVQTDIHSAPVRIEREGSLPSYESAMQTA